jgi:hypothetical protein
MGKDTCNLLNRLLHARTHAQTDLHRGGGGQGGGGGGGLNSDMRAGDGGTGRGKIMGGLRVVEEWEEASYSRHLEDIFPGQGPGEGGNVSGRDGKVSRDDFTTTTVLPLLTLLTVLTALTLLTTTVLRY